MLASDCTGWAPNAARSAVADSLFGEWTELGNPCQGINPENGMGAELTFGGQSTYILPVHGTNDGFIAMFDIWEPQSAIAGRYLWLPIELSDNGYTINWISQWDLSMFCG